MQTDDRPCLSDKPFTPCVARKGVYACSDTATVPLDVRLESNGWQTGSQRVFDSEAILESLIPYYIPGWYYRGAGVPYQGRRDSRMPQRGRAKIFWPGHACIGRGVEVEKSNDASGIFLTLFLVPSWVFFQSKL
jgi:hypothetical protein